MKYYVQVNRHLMATVEANSALAAEHFFLDLDGIQYSHAFDTEGRKTDTFRGALMDCDTISQEQLQALSQEYADARQDVLKANEELKSAKDEVKRLEDLLAQAKEWQDVAEQAHQASIATMKIAGRNLFLND